MIDFWAPWCGPCKFVSPIFEDFSNNADFGHIDFYKVDTDAQEGIAQKAGIRTMPTFIVFKNGVKIGEIVGPNPPALENLLKTSA